MARDVSDRRGMWLPNNMLGATSPGGRSGSPRALRRIPTVRVRAAVLRRPFQHVPPGSWAYMIINLHPSPFWTKPLYVSPSLPPRDKGLVSFGDSLMHGPGRGRPQHTASNPARPIDPCPDGSSIGWRARVRKQAPRTSQARTRLLPQSTPCYCAGWVRVPRTRLSPQSTPWTPLHRELISTNASEQLCERSHYAYVSCIHTSLKNFASQDDVINALHDTSSCMSPQVFGLC